MEMNAPSVINESLVHRFKYWEEGIHQGIRYNNELYASIQSYPTTERLKAYETAYEQARQGHSVCITVSKAHYEVWLNLRSLNRAAQREQSLSASGERS
jgi:hypothetical protein